MRKILLSFIAMSLVGGHVALGKESDQRTKLPAPQFDGPVSVEKAIKLRRSVRQYKRRSLSFDQVSQLLWSAQGIIRRGGYRSAPSAGALYPLEIYLVAGDVEGLSPGVYLYRPKKHELLRVGSEDVRKPLAAAALDQSWVRRAPGVIVITSIYKRITGKYGRRGHRYAHMEVGHVAQNVYLQAQALGLGTVIVGAFDDSEVQRVLALPPDHEPLGIMPVGHKR